MALDKLVDSSKLDAALNYEANRILIKTGGSQAINFDLENEKGFGDIIDTISTSGVLGVTQDSSGYLVLDSASSGNIDNIVLLYDSDNFDYSSNQITTLPGYYAFYGTSLRNISLPNLSYFRDSDNGSYPFYNCKKLIKAYLPNLRAQTITTSGFYNCSNYMFSGCISLQYADSNTIGGLNTALNASTFYNCTSLTICDFREIKNMAINVFKNCSNLTTIIFRNNSIANLGNLNAFDGTPFARGGTGGTIYVPSAQINNYKSASNWSTLFGYGTCTFAAIEGSYYETHYGDGTLISTS